MRHFESVFGVILVALLAAGCQAPSAPPAGNDRVKPEYDKAGRLTRLTYDRDGDGKIDTWGFMDGARVVRVEVDENGDGTVDRWEYHVAAPAGGANPAPGAASARAAVDPTIERVERATKHDGKVSRWEYFDRGVLTRIEEDTNGDGKIDKWETYTDGALSVMALDTKGRGTPDRRLIYGPDGTLTRIEADPRGSGTFQTVSK